MKNKLNELSEFKRIENGDYPLGPCIYFLYHKYELIYIGQSINLKSRLQDHKRHKVFDDVLYLSVQEEELNGLENAFIKRMNPPLNRTNGYETTKYDDVVTKILKIPSDKYLYRGQVESEVSEVKIGHQVLSTCDLKTLINDIANEVVRKLAFIENEVGKNVFSPTEINDDPLDDYVEKKNVVNKLASASTLWKWEKAGKIISYGIGGKRFYKKSDIQEMFTKMKK